MILYSANRLSLAPDPRFFFILLPLLLSVIPHHDFVFLISVFVLPLFHLFYFMLQSSVPSNRRPNRVGSQPGPFCPPSSAPDHYVSPQSLLRATTCRCCGPCFPGGRRPSIRSTASRPRAVEWSHRWGEGLPRCGWGRRLRVDGIGNSQNLTPHQRLEILSMNSLMRITLMVKTSGVVYSLPTMGRPRVLAFSSNYCTVSCRCKLHVAINLYLQLCKFTMSIKDFWPQSTGAHHLNSATIQTEQTHTPASSITLLKHQSPQKGCLRGKKKFAEI